MEKHIKIKHTLIDENSIIHMLAGYNLGPVNGCRFLTRGLNDSYLVTTPKKRYIFRVYRHGWREAEAVQFELDALKLLQSSGFSASFPVAKQDGTLITEIHAPEGIRFGVLFVYAEGVRPEINPENAWLIGDSLGEMHQLSENFSSTSTRGFSLDLQHLVDEPAALILPVIRKHLGKEVEGVIQETAENLKTELAGKQLEIGFCHGDFHNHNMHLNDGEIKVFDFDCCGMGYRAYDVAVSWWNLLTNYGHKEKSCWEAFLNGYLDRRTLSQDDLDSLPLFITARRFWLLGTILENDDVWGSNWINEQALELFALQVKTDRIRKI